MLPFCSIFRKMHLKKEPLDYRFQCIVLFGATTLGKIVFKAYEKIKNKCKQKKQFAQF